MSAVLHIPDEYAHLAQEWLDEQVRKQAEKQEKEQAALSLNTEEGWKAFERGDYKRLGLYPIPMMVRAGCYRKASGHDSGWGHGYRERVIHYSDFGKDVESLVHPDNIPTVMRGSHLVLDSKRPYNALHNALMDRYMRMRKFTATHFNDPEWVALEAFYAKHRRSAKYSPRWRNPDWMDRAKPYCRDGWAVIWLNGERLLLKRAQYDSVKAIYKLVQKYTALPNKAGRLTAKWLKRHNAQTGEME